MIYCMTPQLSKIKSHSNIFRVTVAVNHYCKAYKIKSRQLMKIVQWTMH